MSILNAMYSGVSGLSAEGQALGVVGDNVANTNTVGFKQSRAIFEDVLGSAVGVGGGVGAGVRMARSQQIFAQGSISNTGEPTDLALSGDGFFVVHGSLDGVTGDFYTRAGQTTLRKDGTLVNANGLPLSGYKANPDGSFGTAIGPVTVSTAALQPKPTTQVSVTANIDATATPPAAGWDPQNPGATSNFSTGLVTYDSLGNAHQVSLYFRNTGPNAWEVRALVNGGEIQGGPAGQNVEIAAGALSFTSGGALNAYTLTSGGTANFVNAVPGQAIGLDFGKSIAAGGTGLGGTTQFGAPSNVSAQSQDGYSSGDFTGVSVDSSGVVSGVYSNGQKIAAGQLAVAKFRANDGLARAGHGLWSATLDSGEPALGKAGSGGRAAIVAGALEQSNVDIATQFVDLIAHQRAFQASSKTITTADEMLQELVNLKR